MSGITGVASGTPRGVLLLPLLLFAVGAFGSPQIIRVDGSLYDNLGTPFTGNKDIQIKAYDAASGGALLWTSDVYNASVSSGRFSVNLNAASGSSPSLVARIGERTAAQGIYFQVEVDSGAANGTMNSALVVLPRIRAKGTAFALNAAQADALKGVTASAAEMNFLSGLTANIQTQVNALTSLAAGPNAFSFTDQTGVSTNTVITSNEVVLQGFSGVLPGACSGCTDIVKNGASLGAQWGTFLAGTTVAIKLLSAATVTTVPTTASLAVGARTSATWSVRTGVPDPCDGAPSFGTVCSDGSVYIGISPDGNVPIYTTRCDLGQTWNGSGCTGTRLAKKWAQATGTFLNLTSMTTGESNTAAMVALGTTPSPAPYDAARGCTVDLAGTHGHSDWYLPSIDELYLMQSDDYDLLLDTLKDTAGSVYWSSTEDSGNSAWRAYFYPSIRSTNSKLGLAYIRCVRR